LARIRSTTFLRAAGLLAHTYANTGQPEKAEKLFLDVTRTSTLSETYYNYATFLSGLGRTAEGARVGAKILAKKPPCPDTCGVANGPWFRKANGLLKRLA